jgi:hypothetical protein
METLNLDKALLSGRAVPGKQVVADTSGLSVVHVETKPVKLGQDRGHRDCFAVRVVAKLVDEGLTDNVCPTDQAGSTLPDLADVLKLGETVALELLESGHSLTPLGGWQLLELVHISILDLVKLLARLVDPRLPLRAGAGDLPRKRRPGFQCTVVPQRRR